MAPIAGEASAEGLLEDASRSFLPFEMRRPARPRLHVCYVAQEWLPAHNGVARLVHARASGLAARGHVVRVLTLTEGRHTVALEDGIWVHRLPSTDHPFPPGVIMPPRLWNRSASVLDELVRISETQPIDVVDVPNWDVEGYATIVDGRFRTVLGLHSGVAAYIATDPRFSADDPIMQEVLDAERTCYREADAFIAASDAIVAEIEQGFGVSFPRSRLALVPHGSRNWAKPANRVTTAVKTETSRCSSSDGWSLARESTPCSRRSRSCSMQCQVSGSHSSETTRSARPVAARSGWSSRSPRSGDDSPTV